MAYTIATIDQNDKRGMAAVNALLIREGISLDRHIDYTCGVFDEDYHLCATGSCFGNTFRCLAVDHSHQGEGLLNMIISHLCEIEVTRGNAHLFLYTKPNNACYFQNLGFYEIVQIDDKLVFMENRRDGFDSWLNCQVCSDTSRERTGAIIMNANPFTRGHRYLLEKASESVDAVHLFLLSENYGPISAVDRKKIVEKEIADMPKVILHDSGPYIISLATFPGYFLNDAAESLWVHARLDLKIFAKVASRMNIGVRFVGEEPMSKITGIYNSAMLEELPKAGISCKVLKRLITHDGRTISASTVRQAIHDGQYSSIQDMLSPSTWKYLNGSDGSKIIFAIQNSANVIHG